MMGQGQNSCKMAILYAIYFYFVFIMDHLSKFMMLDS